MEGSDEVKYIASHYREHRFVVEPALRRIKPVDRWWSPIKIAAASIVVAVLGVTATVIVRNIVFTDNTVSVESGMSVETKTEQAVRVIDFEETPLPVVVERIKEVYGVEIIDVPENAGGFRLSLHYEGSADDLLETINDILDTKMKIKQ